jgi:hypothetical protein
MKVSELRKIETIMKVSELKKLLELIPDYVEVCMLSKEQLIARPVQWVTFDQTANAKQVILKSCQ